MDPNFGKTLSYIIVFFGTACVLLGSIGTYYFGKQVEAIAPYKQKIRTATATVNIVIKSKDTIDTLHMTEGGYIAFIKDNKPLLIMASPQCNTKQIDEERGIYHAIFNMDAKDSAIGKPIYFIKETDFIQIEFLPMPEKSKVLSGEAICTFNNNVRIEITILPQETKEKKIFVSDLKDVFLEFEKVK